MGLAGLISIDPFEVGRASLARYPIVDEAGKQLAGSIDKVRRLALWARRTHNER